ncbi:MAG: hypothetical protein ABI743_12685, partial [bacterium]
MTNPFASFFQQFRRPDTPPGALAQLHARLYRLRCERRDLLQRIGEEVTVWHRAGRDTNQLMTEHLRDDLAHLGRLEDQLIECFRTLHPDADEPGAAVFESGSSQLEDADWRPLIVRAHPTAPQPLTDP